MAQNILPSMQNKQLKHLVKINYYLSLSTSMENALKTLTSKFEKVLFQKRQEARNEFNNSLYLKLNSHKIKITSIYEVFEEESGKAFIR
jgi:hypothetical protein